LRPGVHLYDYNDTEGAVHGLSSPSTTELGPSTCLDFILGPIYVERFSTHPRPPFFYVVLHFYLIEPVQSRSVSNPVSGILDYHLSNQRMAAEEARGDVKTIVIVGAGAAGLQAANVLLESLAYINGRLRVIILEARDRVGGRIAIERKWGTPFDCGTYLRSCLGN
jgi:hypothetical protein